ncbi:MAG: hypothetical protein RSF67_08345 [Clostridia bacterium]
MGKPLTKFRPFICLYKQAIDSITYYYFISGTTQNPNGKNKIKFSKYFYKMEIEKFLKLSHRTFFSTNEIYIISHKDMKKFIDSKKNHLGKLSNDLRENIITILKKVQDDKVCIMVLFDLLLSNFYIVNSQKEFKFFISDKCKNKIKKLNNINIEIMNGEEKMNSNKTIDFKRLSSTFCSYINKI